MAPLPSWLQRKLRVNSQLLPIFWRMWLGAIAGARDPRPARFLVGFRATSVSFRNCETCPPEKRSLLLLSPPCPKSFSMYPLESRYVRLRYVSDAVHRVPPDFPTDGFCAKSPSKREHCRRDLRSMKVFLHDRHSFSGPAYRQVHLARSQ